MKLTSLRALLKTLAPAGVAAASLFLSAGCDTTSAWQNTDGGADPLLGTLGGTTRPPATARADATAAPKESRLPPFVPSSPTRGTTPAALAAGTGRTTQDLTRDPRLDSNATTQPTNTQTGWGNPTGAPSGPPDVKLGPPQTAFDSNVQRVQNQGVTPVAGTSDSYGEMKQALATRGVTWQRSESVGDGKEWRFAVAIPNKQFPTQTRNYEARAASELAAMRAVLDQIDRDQQ